MASGLLLAFLAGLVTILNPCVLPLVPILIGSALVMVGTLVLSGLDKVLEAALLDILPDSLVRFTTRF